MCLTFDMFVIMYLSTHNNLKTTECLLYLVDQLHNYKLKQGKATGFGRFVLGHHQALYQV
jgi:hypothetical protein